MMDMEAKGYAHPFSKMPVLQVEGKVLNETVAMCRYLDQMSKNSLAPSDPWAAAKVAQWHSVADDYHYDVIKGHSFSDDKTEGAAWLDRVKATGAWQATQPPQPVA